METAQSIPQWTELGERIQGPDGDAAREEILATLQSLENEVLAAQAQSDADLQVRLAALMEAIQVGRTITETVLKPVDLSAL